MSHRLISTSQGTSQDTLTLAECQCSSNLTINHLPDEVLLEIFDLFQNRFTYSFYRERLFQCFTLTHVCRKWRAIIYMSTSRLDLGITVGPGRPRHLRTILSSPLPIFINYDLKDIYMTKSALWRLRSALKKRNRVRGIFFCGSSAWFDEFFSVTNCTFPKLESVLLRSEYGQDVKIPETFLGGPDLSNLHLQHLALNRFPFKSISRLLLSTSTLTDLHLEIDSAFGITSPETSLPACLQGMPFLCHLNVIILSSIPLKYLPQPLAPDSTLKDGIVPLSKLKRFHYVGQSVFLDAIVAGLSTPALSDAKMNFHGKILCPIVHFPRFIDETKEHWRTARADFGWRCSLLLFNQSERSLFYQPEHSRLHFEFHPALEHSSESIMRMSGAFSPKLITVEELHIFVAEKIAESGISWPKFYQHFPNVRVIRTEGMTFSCFAGTLLQDSEKHVEDLTFFPALEEIELGVSEILKREYPTEYELSAFDPFIFARQQAGRPIKVYTRP